ncbi:bifunctional diaminohydroxyphosphoribosylaminopyrimidine deaminase/5-amino-6-(5-phosphoribosylamino)uracil reductase RibD [Sulfobacillus harzensis]|uniref:Riboflavin biosynthesis protein RibD n=1 Tax=Sulfobacillus harzensis TaxID=2729629 RepID=A0A7Y0L310_9FIRM|nr:bifunctional diaminohydroxyphosphoribosylaminopyrimidine deaminase/5-amino-6-(5-phosphoribosylamino)uracil reductase RibD [Sulfobacillus harzensis]NMP21465.1 bifunctional diaminohydroxyphosphoribosylaminopyrimidine deaminase/5-amino-6-(5-phosphoribosylamino)uracil reductase RibD [Sulfobacillus harzensis]
MTSSYMRRALALAKRGLGHTSPNPMVGAVLVDNQGRIVAEGYHKKAGSAHAEAAALKKAGEKAHGTTLYVTLEPCNHTGRTPPCTDAIIKSGVQRVVVAAVDPNPYVAGGGVERLEAAGVEVLVGDGAEEAWELNRAFFTWSQRHRPWVTLKAAMTLDGKVASVNGQSKYLTSEAALQHAHELRRTHDAILVGSSTVLADNPSLTYRGSRNGHDPVRVVLDGRGRIPATSQVFQNQSHAPTLVFSSEDAPSSWERDIFSAGGEVVMVGRNPDGLLDLSEVLGYLADRHILSLLVEGGPTVHASFIQHQLADAWVGYLAPLILGGQSAPSPVAGPGFDLGTAPRLTMEDTRRLGPDIVYEARFHSVRNEDTDVYRTN